MTGKASKTLLLTALPVALMPLPALAYFGPGGGLTAIGALVALIAVVVYVFFGFVWFPLKHFFKKRKGGDSQQQAEADSVEPGDKS